VQHDLAHWLAIAVRARVGIHGVVVQAVVRCLRDVELPDDNDSILALKWHFVRIVARVAELIEELDAGARRRVEQREIVDVRRRAEREHHVAAVHRGTRLARWLALVVGQNQALAKRLAVLAWSRWPTAATPALEV